MYFVFLYFVCFCFALLFQDITKNLKYVIDVTIGYDGGRPFGIPDVVFGSRSNCKTTVHYRVYSVSSIPRDENSLLRWMYDRYAEKDQLLDRFYRTGSFLDKPLVNGFHKPESGIALCGERTIDWNPYWCWMIHAFYMLSTTAFTCIAFHILKAILVSLSWVVELRLL